MFQSVEFMLNKEQRDPVVIEVLGKKVFGVLHRPNLSEKVPAVVICHGLAGNKVGKYRTYVKLAEALATRGIAALRIDFRGLGDSEGEFSDTTPKTEVEDAIAALNYLSRHKDIDSDRMGIFGRSFGGTIALEASRQYSQVKSIVVWAPLFDASPWNGLWQKYLKGELTQEEFQLYSKIDGQILSSSFLKEFFALELTQTMRCLHHVPLMHIQGGKDMLIQNSHALNFVQARSASLSQTKFICLIESDHEFSVENERVKAIEETAVWFSNTL